MNHEDILKARIKASRYDQLKNLCEGAGTLSLMFITYLIIYHM